MRRALATLASILVLAGSAFVARAGDENERRIDVRHVKVGQRYKFKLTANNQRVLEVTAKTDDEIAYKVHTTVAGKELPAGEPLHFSLKRKVQKDEPGKKSKKIGDETLEVSETKFVCTITETETGGTPVKMWQTNTFPDVIKTQMGKDVTLELVEIK